MPQFFANIWICFGGFIFALIPNVSSSQFTDSISLSNDGEFGRFVYSEEKYGYFKSDSKWNSKIIPVCWESLDSNYIEQRNFVQTVIAETWERYSSLSFIGWEACPISNFVGIRIGALNQHPHVKKLGASISGVPFGMVLNFEYKLEAFEGCNDSPVMYSLCNRAIAVHEFGHALGFAHEHNRTDRNQDCFKRRQGTDGDVLLTPYDPDSVMNYCNPKYANYGKLSYWDIVSLQSVYGAKK